MSEEEIWRCTPRKFFTLLQRALEFAEAKTGSRSDKKKKTAVKAGYIDTIPGW